MTNFTDGGVIKSDKPRKILYFDLETTGLEPKAHGIIQLAGAIEIDGEIKEYFDLKMQPFVGQIIDDSALQVTGTTIEMIKSYQLPKKAYGEFLRVLSKYCDKYDKNDKFYPAGYNIAGFDVPFLAEWFKRNNDPYLGSWINWKCIDPRPYFSVLDCLGKIKLKNYKLETICNHYGIEIKAHDALSDIKATIALVKQMFTNFKDISA